MAANGKELIIEPEHEFLSDFLELIQFTEIFLFTRSISFKFCNIAGEKFYERGKEKESLLLFVATNKNIHKWELQREKERKEKSRNGNEILKLQQFYVRSMKGEKETQ